MAEKRLSESVTDHLAWWLQEVSDNELGDVEALHGTTVERTSPLELWVHDQQGRRLRITVSED